MRFACHCCGHEGEKYEMQEQSLDQLNMHRMNLLQLNDAVVQLELELELALVSS